MKTIKKHKGDLFLIIYALFLSFAMFYILTSCKPTYHLNKFYKKGGKIECNADTVTLTKTIKGKDGKDSLIYINSIEYVPSIEYKTRWEVRFDNKRFADSMKYVRKMYKDSVRTEVKTQRIEGKTKVKVQRAKSRKWLWIILGFSLAHLFRWIWIYVQAFRRFPNGRI